MAATITPSISSLPNILGTKYPQFTFREGDVFKWSAAEQCIYFRKITTVPEAWCLLHELCHALLDHKDYDSDIQLIRKETAAWDHAKKLGPQFGLTIDADYVEDALDTYRDWLHHRSLCPQCAMTGVQTRKNAYNCINCGRSWNANDARTCALRRYVL